MLRQAATADVVQELRERDTVGFMVVLARHASRCGADRHAAQVVV